MSVKVENGSSVKEAALPVDFGWFLENWEGSKNLKEPIMVKPYNLQTWSRTGRLDGTLSKEATCIVCPERLNDVRYINKYLESVNESLPEGGIIVGSVETAQVREKRILSRLPSPLNKVHFFFYYLTKRVWPKLPYLKKVYFALTKGRDRVISEMETYGRLYSCGFELEKSEEVEGKLFFAARKVKAPEYNEEATYGPLIGLRRVGKGGKLLKVYKMRTMYPYSEYVQKLIYEWNGLGQGAKFKDDPRITPLGKFMRKYWLDELPMMWNFLKGDLKLFGVRPISPHYFSLYPKEFQEYRRKFKPGLIPPVYVEIPNSVEDTVDIEWRYLRAYEKNPLMTDLSYTYRAFYNIFLKRIRSK